MKRCAIKHGKTLRWVLRSCCAWPEVPSACRQTVVQTYTIVHISAQIWLCIFILYKMTLHSYITYPQHHSVPSQSPRLHPIPLWQTTPTHPPYSQQPSPPRPPTQDIAPGLPRVQYLASPTLILLVIRNHICMGGDDGKIALQKNFSNIRTRKKDWLKIPVKES